MLLLILQAANTAASTVMGSGTPVLPVTDPGISTTIDAVAHQAGLIAITVWGLQMVKRSPWFPGINANSETATRLLSTLCALGAAMAVQISVSGDASHGWQGTFAIPSLHAMWDGFIRFSGQKMGQELLYSTVYKKPIEVTPVLPPPMNSQGKPVEDKPDVKPVQPVQSQLIAPRMYKIF